MPQPLTFVSPEGIAITYAPDHHLYEQMRREPTVDMDNIIYDADHAPTDDVFAWVIARVKPLARRTATHYVVWPTGTGNYAVRALR